VLAENKEIVKSVLELLSREVYLVTFLSLLLENALFIGFVVPGVTVLLLVGYLSYSGDFSFWGVAAVGTVATILGDNINYALGRLGATHLRWVRRLLDRYPKVGDYFHRGSPRIFVFYHFPGYLRTVFPLWLGTVRFPLRKWLWIELIGAPLFNITFMLAGWLVARFTQEIMTVMQVGNYIIYFFVLLSLVWLVALGRRVREQMRPKAPFPADKSC
jgi:membrane-associated protein